MWTLIGYAWLALVSGFACYIGLRAVEWLCGGLTIPDGLEETFELKSNVRVLRDAPYDYEKEG